MERVCTRVVFRRFLRATCASWSCAVTWQHSELPFQGPFPTAQLKIYLPVLLPVCYCPCDLCWPLALVEQRLGFPIYEQELLHKKVFVNH